MSDATDIDRSDGMSATDKGLWGLVALLGGYCLVTMVFVPLLAVAAAGYLGVTGRYLAAVALTAFAGVAVFMVYRRRWGRAESGEPDATGTESGVDP
jgi:Na+-driven multidrug efflux pump